MGSSGEQFGDGRVRVARAPGLTSVHGTVLPGPGDMMIDGVVPLVCGRAGLSGPSIPAESRDGGQDS